MTETQGQVERGAGTAGEPHAPHGFDAVGGVLGLVLPGLGHVYQGRVKRGLLAGAGVLGMFFGGLLIGGIDSVDSREDRLWFAGQAFVGPIAFGVDWVHQTRFKAYGPPVLLGPEAPAEVLRTVAPGERVEVVDGVRRVVGRGDGPADPPNMKGWGKVGEIGTLYGTVAGMVNLIVVLDALFPPLVGGSLRRRGS